MKSEIKEFYIVNESGNLIYSKTNKNLSKNDECILASSLTSLYEIAKEALNSNNNSLFICMKENEISIYRTLTNLTFIFLAEGRVSENYFGKIYKKFSVCVLSNPFYNTNMTCDDFY
ncbi:hypothetical protein A0H76_2341 [Hepatospora eriocheir]|uniref:Trafficking protein particle complex subunit n=1 Tax=Hepatospora eriocheir TaxID=1081669 RepID=A0A1X0QK45_9MICR|nr:hypothetical protein A0H76_2341 [Hepatospora eriocheir]